jgi:hypothetical protein
MGLRVSLGPYAWIAWIKVAIIFSLLALLHRYGGMQIVKCTELQGGNNQIELQIIAQNS